MCKTKEYRFRFASLPRNVCSKGVFCNPGLHISTNLAVVNKRSLCSPDSSRKSAWTIRLRGGSGRVATAAAASANAEFSLRRFRSRYEEHLNIIREALGRPIVDWVGSASPENKIGCSSAEQRVGPIGRPGVGGGWPHITTLPSSKPLRDYPELKEFVDVE